MGHHHVYCMVNYAPRQTEFQRTFEDVDRAATTRSAACEAAQDALRIRVFARSPDDDDVQFAFAALRNMTRRIEHCQGV